MRRFISIAILLVNCVGIYVYIMRASLSWPIPEEAGLNPGAAGPALVWVLGALPVILLFALADAVWLYIVRAKKPDRTYVYAAGVMWLCAALFDLWHYW
jgi:hypothetical protein